MRTSLVGYSSRWEEAIALPVYAAKTASISGKGTQALMGLALALADQNHAFIEQLVQQSMRGLVPIYLTKDGIQRNPNL